MINVAQACVTDVEQVLQSIAKLSGKVLQVYSEEDLLNKTKSLQFPCAGVTYEGMRASAEQAPTGRMGIAGELVISIVLVESFSNIHAGNTKAITTKLLDDIRGQMMGRRSPSGHYWRFIVEAAAAPKNGSVFWLQRWQTPVLLVPTIPT
jgi:hypothetical protein